MNNRTTTEGGELRRLRRSIQILARRTPEGLRRFVKRAFVPHSFISWLYRGGRVQQLQRAMQAGFGKASAKKLEELKVYLPPAALADAAWALAYWHRLNGDYERALDNLVIRRLADPRVLLHTRHIVVEAEVLLKLGRVEAARSTVEHAIKRLGEVPELCYSAANVAASGTEQTQFELDQLRLYWLNKPFLAAGVAPIELKDPSAPLTIDNIEAPSAQLHSRSGEAKISVLMPAYNAEDTIALAMESVLSQTWANLELIVVDDGSNDGTWPVIDAAARRDQRVVTLKHSSNRGAYAARNTALSHAIGDFVTVHDSDDWSHPEQLALQMLALIESGGVANATKQIRVNPSMRFSVKPDGATILTCYSSLIARRETLLELAGWDEARMQADDELWTRLALKHREAKQIVEAAIPLSFGLFRDDSLTSQRHTGSTSIHYGARRQYIESYRYWHALELNKAEPDLTIRTGERRFPLPHICRPGPQRELDYDMLLVSDFSLPGGTTVDNINMLCAARALSMRCGCLHWPRFQFAGKAIDIKMRRLLHGGIADNVVGGESLSCRLVVINHPPLLNQLPDALPDVRTDACIIVVNQTPKTRWKGGETLYNFANVLDNAGHAFGVTPTLAPISPLVRRILTETTRDVGMTPLDWTPLIDPEQYRRERPAWDRTRNPVIGRHGRDSPDKWPVDRGALSQAYCANAALEVRILGGANGAKRVLGRIPSNWTVIPFDSVDVRDFLRGLDFFIHYPHEHWIEAFGRAPMEAMATGVPVILPVCFQETFGDAALYVEPADVLDTIQRLWSDIDAYEAQVERGFDYVERTCSLSRFEERVRPFLSHGAILDSVGKVDVSAAPISEPAD